MQRPVGLPWAAILCMWELPGQVVPCRIVVSMFQIDFDADGRFSLTGLLTPIAHENLHSEHKIRIKTTVVPVLHLLLR